MKSILKTIFSLVTIAILFIECGKRLHGGHEAEIVGAPGKIPGIIMEFNGDKVIVSNPERKTTCRYRIEGDTIRFEPIGVTGEMAQKGSGKIQADGSITMGSLVFRRK